MSILFDQTGVLFDSNLYTFDGVASNIPATGTPKGLAGRTTPSELKGLTAPHDPSAITNP